MRSSKLAPRHICSSGILCVCVRLCVLRDRLKKGGGVVMVVFWDRGYVGKELHRGRTTGVVKHRNRQASNHSPCPSATAVHSCCNASKSMRHTAICAPPLVTIRSSFLTGSPTFRIPVSLRVADGKSQSPRPAMFFPHPLCGSLSRLPRPLTLHSPRAASPSPTHRTVCCAAGGVPTQYVPPTERNLPRYVPYLPPACHSPLLLHFLTPWHLRP